MFATVVNQEMKVLPVVVGQAPDSFLPVLLSAVTPGQAEKTFDRSSYVFNVWFPISGTAEDQDALWPNKFLLPAKAIGSPSVAI